MMNDKYKIVCAWCKTIIQDGPEPDNEVSHGICADCLFIQSQILRFRKQVGFEELSGLTDAAIWKVYKNSTQMAIIRLGLRVDEFQQACLKAFPTAEQAAKNINIAFNKLRKLFHAENT